MPEMTNPARRHKCEFCLNVFECHLCTIHEAHFLHWEREEHHGESKEEHYQRDPLKRQHAYRCVACIEAAESPAIYIGNNVRVNELTGKRLPKVRRVRKAWRNYPRRTA